MEKKLFAIKKKKEKKVINPDMSLAGQESGPQKE